MRSPVNYSIAQLEIASDSVFYIYQTLSDVESRMSDDLHTQDILNASLLDALRLINRTLDRLKKRKQQQAQMFHSIIALEKEVKQVVDGLGSLSPILVSEELKVKALNRAGLTMEEVAVRIEERLQARTNKEHAKSEHIRLDLTAKGIALMDLGKYTIWRPCVPQKHVEPVSTPVEPSEPVSTHIALEKQTAEPVLTQVAPETQPPEPVSTPVEPEQVPVATPDNPVEPVSS